MNPEKQKKPVAVTTDLRNCRHPRADKTTNAPYHPKYPRQADYSGNCVSFIEVLQEVWEEVQETSFPQRIGGGK